MKKLIKALLLSFVLLLLLTKTTDAAGSSSCQPIYGGGQICPEVSFTVNKTVQTMTKGGQFVDNLSKTDARFQPSQTINFRIEIKNTGNKSLSNFQVTDIIPQFLNFVSGPGSFNQNNKTLSFTVGNIDPGQTQSFIVTVKAAEERDLPANQGITCPVNQVNVRHADAGTASDSSQVCIERAVLGAVPAPQVFQAPQLTTTPPTGPEALPLIALLSSGLVGYFINKSTKK